MASPLSPLQDSVLNASIPATATSRRLGTYEVLSVQSSTTHYPNRPAEMSSTLSSSGSPTPSADGLVHNQENVSPCRTRNTRIMSGTELSPLKILTDGRSPGEPDSDRPPSSTGMTSAITAVPSAAINLIRSPRKLGMERRFPVKVSNPLAAPRAAPSPATLSAPSAPAPHATPVPVAPPRDAERESRESRESREISIDAALHDNEGLKRAIEIFEDEDSGPEPDEYDDGDLTTITTTAASTAPTSVADGANGCSPVDDAAGPDDTMMSTFSTFSAVPNMTMYSRLGPNPADTSATPRARPDSAPLRGYSDSGNTTNLLMEFTEQLRYPQKSSLRRGMSPSRTAPNLVDGPPATPARQLSSLIDFDIPPLPTPRSIPTITPRELESLKSGFLSEISSLKASLSGKEAEALSLKTAVGDAEKRVGECMEQVREERSQREQLAVEKDVWEKRGREMETVLRKVKEEIVRNQREREELELKLDESEKRREAAEMMAQDAESKMAGMRAAKATEERERTAAAAAAGSPDRAKSPPNLGPSASNTAREVEMAVERVARELHALYKSKHEAKVTALKKSYEGRWEKRVRELESKVEELGDDNERLRLGRDATMTRVEPGHDAEERAAQAARDAAHMRELAAEVEKLEAVVGTVQRDNDELRRMLELERVEKGELVLLAEEMMSMQSVAPPARAEPEPAPAAAQAPRQPRRPASVIGGPGLMTPVKAGARTPAAKTQQPPSAAENPRSMHRQSMLRAPGSLASSLESRIGKASHERTRSGGPSTGGLPRPGTARSGIMSSIERMGSHRGRGE